MASTIGRESRSTSRWVNFSPNARSAVRATRMTSTITRSSRSPRSAGCATGIMPSTSYQLRSGNQRSHPVRRQRTRNSIRKIPQTTVSPTNTQCATSALCGKNST